MYFKNQILKDKFLIYKPVTASNQKSVFKLVCKIINFEFFKYIIQTNQLCTILYKFSLRK